MNKQILDVVASVSMEKGVDKTIIFQALEEAIASATKKLVDDEANIDVVIDTTTGEYKTYRKWDIVKEIDESEVFQVLESDLDGVLLLLSSEASSFMTGSIIPVDGGHLINPL